MGVGIRGLGFRVQSLGFGVAPRCGAPRYPLSLLLTLTEVPLLLCDVPLSTFVSVGSALQSRRKGNPDSSLTDRILTELQGSGFKI